MTKFKKGFVCRKCILSTIIGGIENAKTLNPYPLTLDKKSNFWDLSKRHFWTKNPDYFPEYIIIIFKNIFLEIESASFLDKRTRMCSVFLSENDASSVPKIRSSHFKKSPNRYTMWFYPVVYSVTKVLKDNYETKNYRLIWLIRYDVIKNEKVTQDFFVQKWR